jgi:phage terminase small subunit
MMSRARKIITTDLHGLQPKELNFVIEFCKDFSPRRAAEASGYQPDSGYDLRNKPQIQAAIDKVLQSRLDASHIDAEWVLMEAVDNHMIARQAGNISASNTALNLVAKHTFVDAYAAEKVEVSSDADVMARLLRGRERARKGTDEDEPAEDVSFF